jgi:alcohol dehydrogenase (cytochrome c)
MSTTEKSLSIVSLFGAAVLALALAPTPMGQSPTAQGLPVTYERLLKATEEPGNWLTYSGDYRSHHYSSLNQITVDNVHKLRAKWIYQMHRTKVGRLQLSWMA